LLQKNRSSARGRDFPFASAGLAPDRIDLPIGLRWLLCLWIAAAIAGLACMLDDFGRYGHIVVGPITKRNIQSAAFLLQ
jgi:hypothetical protein